MPMKAPYVKLITPEFRVSYPYIFEPQTQKNDDGTTRKEYSLVAIFPAGADLTAFANDRVRILEAEFGAKENWPENLRSPFRKCKEKWKVVDGKQVIPEGYEEGDACWMTFKATEKHRPGLVDQNMQDIIEPKDFYPGCYARASVNLYYYSHKKGGKGVSVGLLNVQKTRDGKPLGGSAMSKPTDDFTPVAGASGGSASSVFDD